MNSALKFRLLLVPVLISFFSCTKIDTTTLGDDLIPVVDNINTFDTLLTVVSNNYIPEDSTRYFRTDPHPSGQISNDPLFGTTKATMFFEMKPTSFPNYFGAPDSLAFDSAVLILEYVGLYGDTASLVNFKLYETDRKMDYDTLVRPNYTIQPDIGVNRSKLWGQKTMAAFQYKDTVEIRRGDSLYGKATNQLRIRLSDQMARDLFFQDTLGAYKNDSSYKEYLPGFALEAADGANAIHYFGLYASTSRIEFFYRLKNGTSRIDTTSTSFPVTNNSAHAVRIDRNRAGAAIGNFLANNPATGVPEIFIQSAPNTSASIKINGFGQLSNRLIHRAELRITQIAPDNGPTSQLVPPPILYLDLADTGNTFKGVPYDLSPFSNYFCYPGRGIEYGYFGGPTRYEVVDGNVLAIYKFNLTRFLQAVTTRNEQSFDFRLSAPYYMYYKNCSNGDFSYPGNYFPLLQNNSKANLPGNGRVRLAGGNHPDPKLRMQFRIIYSKI